MLQNGAPAAAGKAVSLSASPVSCATPVGSATTDASGVAVLNATATAAGPCVLTAFAPGYGSASSQTFNSVAPVGRLGCDTGNNTFGTTGANSLVQNGTRLGNVSDPLAPPIPGCVVVPYIVSGTCPAGVTGAACTNFTYDPLNQGTNMAFVFRWEWPLEAIPPGGIGAIQNTGQLFINGNPTPLNLDLCREIVPAFALDGTFTGLATGSPPPADQETSVPGTQAGCLVRRVVKQVGNQIQLIEDAYVQGDYTARRN